MRRSKIVLFAFFMMVVMILMPTRAFAADSDSDGYDDDDFNKMQTFLNQPSAVAGKSNGQQLNASYNPSDPTTWTGVTWSGTRIEKVGSFVDWEGKSLAGSLDVSGCTGMTFLCCGDNEITSVNVSGCSSLNYLYCYKNNLTSANTTGCAELIDFYCYDNLLTSLNLNDNIKIVTLYCYDNNLTSLNISTLTALQTINCYSNLLTSLDAHNNTELTYIYASANNLTSINISGLTKLYSLDCSVNNLTSLDVSSNTKLEYIFCRVNDLDSLDVSSCTKLRLLEGSSNDFTSLDVSGLQDLYILNCQYCLLTSINVSNTPALLNFFCNNNQLTSLDLSGHVNIAQFQSGANMLKNIDIVAFGHNISLTASGNGYVSLDFSNANDMVALATVKSGETFYNWTSFGTTVGASNSYDLAAGMDHTLAANFSKTSYTVAFDSKGGSAVSSLTALYGDKITAPTDPSKTDCKFEGWYKDDDYINKWNFATDTVTANITLYAKWSDIVKITGLADTETMYVGGHLVLKPAPAGGTWGYDTAFFTKEKDTFTALKDGTSTITYTVGNEQKSIVVTIRKATLPVTGQSDSLITGLLELAVLCIVAAGVLGWQKKHKKA